MQTCIVQAIIIIGPGKLARNVGYLAAPAKDASATTTTTLTSSGAVTPGSGIQPRCILPRNRGMRELIGIIQATYGSDIRSEVSWESWLRSIGIKNAPIRPLVVINRYTKDLFCQ